MSWRGEGMPPVSLNGEIGFTPSPLLKGKMWLLVTCSFFSFSMGIVEVGRQPAQSDLKLLSRGWGMWDRAWFKWFRGGGIGFYARYVQDMLSLRDGCLAPFPKGIVLEFQVLWPSPLSASVCASSSTVYFLPSALADALSWFTFGSKQKEEASKFRLSTESSLHRPQQPLLLCFCCVSINTDINVLATKMAVL